ncbi:glucuronate isomerase [Cellulophaga sp. F20128]|uniref:glucuronate isomerase n=1 Tax=Cellulophaga sp. F20128 TaxID=2926413 RepID=UPI001FF65BCB|nr:glucuronate isomerase [Cellulophaga sp. F20128]MCK0156322.1 glucuronate isomerase [Cellulophaga sp. F20128]
MVFKDTNTFITDDFLLSTETAKQLYHEYAKDQPIIDYHNHLSPKVIAENKPFANLYEAWLEGDHYKWRAMRAAGVEEKYITGTSTTPWEKFEKWAETVPKTVRNPLFHWTHLELERYFGIKEILQPSTAKKIYDTANEQLKTLTPRKLLRKLKVVTLCTTDDPIDTLEHHQFLKDNYTETAILPGFRPDKALDINLESYTSYLNSLEASSGITIKSLEHLLASLEQRVNHFHNNGCRVSDHGLNNIPATPYTENEVNAILKNRLAGKIPSAEETLQFKSCVLYELAKMYHKKNWVQQFHLGPIRNNNSKLMQELGADVGCDSIGDYPQAVTMSAFFDKLNKNKVLANTITYNLNPADNELFATMMGNYNSAEAKMQWGSAWWFLDQKDGMEKQINTLSNLGLLSTFIGMLTDSRSFLSYPRHEYFRRLLCNLIGTDIEKGELPADIAFFGKLVENISYKNAANYFNF